MKKIYLDYAASTPLDYRVERAMKPFWKDHFGNPHAIHQEGVYATRAVSSARKNVAHALQVHESEIFFVGSGTEANNLAILGTHLAHVSKKGIKKPHMIISSFEHASVRVPAEYLEKNGWGITRIPVTKEGIIDIHAFKRALRNETMLVSCVYVNNEVGTIQPLKEIALTLRKFRGNKDTPFPYFHTDASQATRFLSIRPREFGVDLLTLDGQKIYGPKGVGALYKKSEAHIAPIIYGGKQESNLRPGTENVPGIVGMAEAMTLCEENRKKEWAHLVALRDFFLFELAKHFPLAEPNGNPKKSVPGIINIYFPFIIDAERLLIDLDREGVLVSLGSACGTHGSEPSYTVYAISGNKARSTKSIRISFGRETTKKDLTYVIMAFKKVLKSGSPNIV